MPGEVIITVIADREADIYKALCSMQRENTHLLIRSSSNRLTCHDNMLLHDKMQNFDIKILTILKSEEIKLVRAVQHV